MQGYEVMRMKRVTDEDVIDSYIYKRRFISLNMHMSSVRACRFSYVEADSASGTNDQCTI